MKSIYLFVLVLYVVIPAEYWGAIRILMNDDILLYAILISLIKFLVGGAVGYFTVSSYLGDK